MSDTVAKPIPRRFRSPVMLVLRWIAQRCLLGPTLWIMVRVTVTGKENLKALTGSYIAVGNHSSHLDAPLIVCAIPWKHAKYLASGAAADYFFDHAWRRVLTSLFFNAYPVDRTGGGTRPRLSRALLANDCSLLIFPEGGRAAQGAPMRPFKPGAASLSISTTSQILPIGLVGSQQAMPRGKSWPVWGRKHVEVNIGAPMYAEPDETAREFAVRMERTVADLSTQPHPVHPNDEQGAQQ